MQPPLCNVAVCVQTQADVILAQSLAQQWQLPFIEEESDSWDYLLQIGEQGVCLLSQHHRFSPFQVDFLSGKARHRRLYGGGRHQLLTKAVGLHKVKTLSVWDLTAGWGADAFVLASWGADVTMVECCQVVAVLLQDALSRAQSDPDFAALSFRLVHQNAIDFMQNTHSSYPDVIYLDPMFPEKEQSALPQKSMIILKDLVGPAHNTDSLFNLARGLVKKRVVVKRPRTAPFLCEAAPNYSLSGKSGRYDIYLSQSDKASLSG